MIYLGYFDLATGPAYYVNPGESKLQGLQYPGADMISRAAYRT